MKITNPIAASAHITSLKEANLLYSHGDYKKALSLYKMICEEKPALQSIIEYNIKLTETKLAELENRRVTTEHEESHEVIVCVHNAPAETLSCLSSLQENADGYSIIIVDDCSEPETALMLKNFSKDNPAVSRIIRTSSNMGYTGAANTGIKQSTASLVTLLNSDCITTKGWARRIREHFTKHARLGIVGALSNAASYQSVPGIKGTDNQTAINKLPDDITPEDIAGYCARTYSVEDMPYVPLVHGFCFTIKKSCLDNVGLFDLERFPRGYGEETDFCIRAQKAGYALGIALNVYIYHAKSKSYAESDRVKNMNDGWNSLVEAHGKRYMKRLVSIMANHSHLKQVRSLVRRQFYNPKESGTGIMPVPPNWCVRANQRPFTIAFYLPQFHPTPENDENWGKGFTEWTNVAKAKPRFADHYQPRLPGELGFYDLRLPSAIEAQVALAKEYCVDGFCFYYYRFKNKRLLDAPLKIYQQKINNRLPFCYCWANESWTRAWDGQTSDVLFEQTYDETTLSGISIDLVKAINTSSYIMIDGCPIFIIYQASKVPNLGKFISDLKEFINHETGHSLLVGTNYSPDFCEETQREVDFVVQFPPHRIPRNWKRKTIPQAEIAPYDPSIIDYYEDYDTVIESSIASCSLIDNMFPGVCPDWDNSSRRQVNATTLIGSSPQKFAQWVSKASGVAIKKVSSGTLPVPIIFINAWNEWAEGAQLEPSAKYGRAYLESLRKGLSMNQADASK